VRPGSAHPPPNAADSLKLLLPPPITDVWKLLELDILRQPDNVTCGPTCLHAVYRYYRDEMPLEAVIRETPQLEEGGTLAVLLGRHALARGYKAKIYTYNLAVFDPTWFRGDDPPLVEKLYAQMEAKESLRLHLASRAYIDFLNEGGEILMEDLTSGLLRRFLKRGVPVLAGLSSTFLYGSAREIGPTCEPDDVRGAPTGHFVVLSGYDKKQRRVLVADPYLPNPGGHAHYYQVPLARLVCAIMLGVLTYDANLLIIEPGKEARRRGALSASESQKLPAPGEPTPPTPRG
jgi:Peptidase_C39 like family